LACMMYVCMYHNFRGTFCLCLQRSRKRQDLPPEHWYLPLGSYNFKKEAYVFYLWNQHMHTPYTQHYKFHPSNTFCRSITHQVT
jgi:hypothetical protein